MLSKEEAKQLRLDFWKAFRRYCGKNKIDRHWVLTGVKIKSVQLKFFVDEKKALVLFQIDHKSDLRRYEIYECFQSYRKLMEQDCGTDLQWEEDYLGIEERPVSAIYFELPGVSIYNPDDWSAIHSFFVAKMIPLEEAYWEYRDLINARIKNSMEE